MRHHTPTTALRHLPRSRSLVAVCSLLSGILLALTFATPASAAPSANARCISEAAQAGLIGPDRNPSNTNFVSFTEGNDFRSGVTAAGPDVFCGFGGNDIVFELNTGDVFLGGEGNDRVILLDGGTFNGGEGDDNVRTLNGGTFNGEEGSDSVNFLNGGTFNGGAGDDSVGDQIGGTFNQD